jgi:hypothetical protein
MGSELQPGLMKAQKREIIISRVTKMVQYGTGSLFYNYSANLF